MDPEARLRSLAADRPAHVTDPASSLGRVTRRGRLYLAGLTAVSVLGTSSLVFAAVALVPDRIQPPEIPQIVGTPDRGPAAPEPSDDDGPAKDLKAVEPSGKDRPDEDEARSTEDPDLTASPAPPALSLVVLSPADGAELDDPRVTFAGEVTPGAKVTVGPYRANVTDDGRWSIGLVADEGSNTVTFHATSPDGQKASRTITVTYTAPEPTKTTPPADEPTGTWTANQKHAEIHAPFTNLYWGTAPAGQKVKVLSDHGYGITTARADGTWDLEVTFTPPHGTTTFPVTAKLWDHPETSTTMQLTTVNGEAAPTLEAHQKYREVSGNPPVNVYWGTVDPGAKVRVHSDYGSGYVYAASDGSFELPVEFHTAPAGTTTFTVTASLYHQPHVSQSFTLTTTRDGDAAVFTATQQHASVPTSDPSNGYSGTGAAEHEVLVWTEQHGQATTTIGPDGTWELRMVYQDVTAGQTFHVKAMNTTTGERIVFEVTITG